MRRRLRVTTAAFLKAYRFKLKVVICKALAVAVKHTMADRHESPLTSAATSSSSLYDLSTDFSISDDQTTQCPTDAHQVSLFEVVAWPLSSGMASPFTVLSQHLIDSLVIDEPFYSPAASLLTDVDEFHSLFATPSSGIDEFLHSSFVTPLTDVDEFYSPPATPLADVDELFYSPSATCVADVEELYYSPLSPLLAGESYCTPLSSRESSSTIGSLVDELTPYFSPDSDLRFAAKTPIVSSGIGLGILVLASPTVENEFLFFDTPLSSVTTLDEYNQDEHRSPVVSPILDFISEPVVSDQMADELAHTVEAASIPLPDSPLEHGDFGDDAVNFPLPDSPVEHLNAADIPLPDSPIERVNALDIPLPESPVELVDAEEILLPDSPIECVDPVDIPLPDSPTEQVDAVDVPLPDSPIELVDAMDVPLPDSPVARLDAVDIPLPDSPAEQVNGVDVPLPHSPIEDTDATATDLPSSPVGRVTSLSYSAVGQIELAEAALIPLPDSPLGLEEAVELQSIIPRASPVLSVASSESSPVLDFTMPASPNGSCSCEALDQLAQDLANFSLRGDVPSIVAAASRNVEEPLGLEYILHRASPALSVASSSSSPTTQFTVPASPVFPRPYVAFSRRVENFVNLDRERALIASPQVDMITQGFANIGLDEPKDKMVTEVIAEPQPESQVCVVFLLREVE